MKTCLFIVALLSIGFSKPDWPVKSISIPRRVDTTLMMRADNGSLLRFRTYFRLLLEGDHYAEISKGNWYLRKYPDSTLKYIRMYRNRLDSTTRIRNIFQRLSRADKVVVLKSRRRMHIQRGGKILFDFSVNLGKNPIGHKQKDGDGRTPEGNYTLDNKLWQAKYYTNFHISYPDSIDLKTAARLKVKPGGDVMIHGTSAQRSKLKDWTNGCIAISNAQMDTLFKYVGVGTMIEIRK